jgi:hypothetical protein
VRDDARQNEDDWPLGFPNHTKRCDLRQGDEEMGIDAPEKPDGFLLVDRPSIPLELREIPREHFACRIDS